MVVTPFVGDRKRGMDAGDTLSTKLLRQKPTGALTTVTVYGSDWCAACHRGRASGGVVHNHPVDSLVTNAPPRDRTVDNFRFHPDYRIDRILFREIIGTVTDAVYLRPHARATLAKNEAFAVTASVVNLRFPMTTWPSNKRSVLPFCKTSKVNCIPSISIAPVFGS